MSATVRSRALFLAVALLVAQTAAAACGAPAAAPASSGDPANGITIDNATGVIVAIEYERPDGQTESLTELAPGAQTVVDSIFAEREGICRTGRLVAIGPDGAEIDELYLVCRGGTWMIEPPS
jgi:hypothetical protein